MDVAVVVTEMQTEAFEAFLAAHGLSCDETGVVWAPTGQAAAFTIRVEGIPTMWLGMYEESYQADGSEVKSWWPMARPSYVISDFDGNVLEIGPPLGPDEVICDLCSAEIHTRPVPVVDDNALCPECFAELGIPFPSLFEPYDPSLLVMSEEEQPDEND